MTEIEIQNILEKQHKFFQTGQTLPVNYRIEQLKKLKDSIIRHEPDLNLALKADLGKSETESYMCEVGLTLSELSWMLKHIKKLTKEKWVPTPLAQFAAKSFRSPSPYGTVLIMSPWNYPVLLTLEPLIDALAAGNTAVVKPSAYAPATSRVMQEIIEECFSEEYVAVVTGGRAENQALLNQRFDKIFFTGGKTVGREVLRHAAEYLTPVTLELGGKSPCIVDSTAKIPLAARRIVFGKYLNCGQTCVAPDYILCDKAIRDQLIDAIKSEIRRQFGKHPLENPSYGKIINRKHFQRLQGLIDSSKVIIGGQSDAKILRIAPTVMKNVTWDDAIMGEEIFGPILPILTYESLKPSRPWNPIHIRWHCISSVKTKLLRRKSLTAVTSAVAVSTIPSSILPPAPCRSVVSAKAAWADITDRPDLMSLHITEVLWIRRRGWICRCGIRGIISLRGRCCGCF